MTTRRDFLKGAALAGTGLAAGVRTAAAGGHAARGQGLNLLILGGTGFIGPHLVREAVARGHRVTTFTRGRRDADLPASVTRLVGDRNGQLQALEGKRWDAVIDDSATNPDWVRQSIAVLRGNVGQYLFTSSTGVYYPYLRRGVDESDAVRTVQQDEKDGSETYAVQKANCEKQVMEAFGAGGIVVRPTYIIGPGDTTDRFPYWPVRLAKGGETLAPGRPEDPVQIVDVRDLVAFMVKLVEDRKGGLYNAAGPREVLTFGAFLQDAARAIRSTSTFTWIPDHAFLKAHGIQGAVPWIMLEGNNEGHTSIKNAKAVAAGLRFRPLAETVRDTLAWWPSVPEARRNAPRFAISAENEAKALADWKAR
ncbi:MAG: NAD-dependent epimerase/dehydratase family protein [Gemmatimonadetes bacterium]|nr:NAD-dependent epimerase/dehydratase family protein [Gemmatimonadota bacterium]